MTVITTRDSPIPRATRPSVSVAIASFNYGHYLRDSVTSALAQEDIDVEVIIVDDASTDNSVQVAREIAAADPRVRLLVHHQNHGHIATFNEALSEAQGEFVVKLDSDDMLTPGSLSRSVSVMLAHPSVGLVYGNPLEFNNSPPPRPSMEISGVRFWRGLDWLTLRCRRATNCIMQPEVMLRTSILNRTDGHRRHLTASHDLNLWLRIATISDVARINGADQGFYRVHPDSLLQSKFGTAFLNLVERRKAFEDFFETLPEGIIDVRSLALLRTQNSRSLARQALAHANRIIDERTQELEDLESYIEFAHSVYPTTRQLRQWRALQRRRSPAWQWNERHWLSMPARALRSLDDRVRWRKWRRFGT